MTNNTAKDKAFDEYPFHFDQCDPAETFLDGFDAGYEAGRSDYQKLVDMNQGLVEERDDYREALEKAELNLRYKSHNHWQMVKQLDGTVKNELIESYEGKLHKEIDVIIFDLTKPDSFECEYLKELSETLYGSKELK